MYRYLSLFHATGSVEPKEPSGDQSKGLTEFESFTILQSIYFTSRQLTLRKFNRRDYISLAHGFTFQPSAVQQQGFSRKKVQSIALQQSETKRIQFMTEFTQIC